MIRLATVIETFKDDLIAQYGDQLLPSHHRALAAISACRSAHSPRMQVQCEDCAEQRFVPHSCGHRACPHCQHHESQQWLERQLQRQVPADYFLVTFTIPAELRELAWLHQRTVYGLLLQCSWETLDTFARNDRRLQGTTGAITVLHTHSRRLDYHPHVHLAVPAAAVDAKNRRWRTKTGSGRKGKPYLFSQKALAKVFRAKVLAALTQAGLPAPSAPKKWVVDCTPVGSGEKALVYLGRYLYRGVLQEKDILACETGEVTFRYQDSKTRKTCTRTLSGADFLWLLLRHVLPKGFRRARNYGFLHPNRKRLIHLLQVLLKLRPVPMPAFLRCLRAEGAVRPEIASASPGPRLRCRRDRKTPPVRRHQGIAATLLAAVTPRHRKSCFQTPTTHPEPGLSNKRFRSWFASLSRSNLIR